MGTTPILSKLDWARDSRSELQLRDVHALLETPIDSDYVQQWATKLDLEDVLAEARDARYGP
jgi:hypothetical protein